MKYAMSKKVAWQLIDSDITRYSFQLQMSEDIFKLVMILKNLNPYQTYELLWRNAVSKELSVPPLESCPSYYKDEE